MAVVFVVSGFAVIAAAMLCLFLLPQKVERQRSRE